MHFFAGADDALDSGGKQNVHAKLHEEVNARQSDDYIQKHILSAGPAAYRVKEKYQHAQDEQSGIHNGANNAGHDDRSLVVFLCYRLIAQTCGGSLPLRP